MYKMNEVLRTKLLVRQRELHPHIVMLFEEFNPSFWFMYTSYVIWKLTKRGETWFMNYQDCDYTLIVAGKTAREAYQKCNQMIRKLDHPSQIY